MLRYSQAQLEYWQEFHIQRHRAQDEFERIMAGGARKPTPIDPWVPYNSKQATPVEKTKEEYEVLNLNHPQDENFLKTRYIRVDEAEATKKWRKDNV